MSRGLIWPLVFGCLALPGVAMAAVPPECTEAMLSDAAHPNGISFGPAAAKAGWLSEDNSLELPFEPPVLSYPYGSLNVYGFDVNFVVSVKGRIECASIKPAYRATGPAINAVRHQFLEEMSGWQIKPFLVDGKPVRAASSLDIDEVELPQAHVPKPEGDAAQVTITQAVVPAYASYGPYHVELHGDGTAIYMSQAWDDPLGPQSYRVDPKAVQALVTEAEKVDFWSLRDVYRSPNGYNDHLSYQRLNITLGGKTKSLTDNGGRDAGMSGKVAWLQNQVLVVAQIDFWQRPSLATLEQLRINGYDFHSKLAGVLLLKMIQNGGVRDEAIFALMDMGAPLESDDYDDTFIEAALRNGRPGVATRLIRGGALLTDGAADHDKINWAFYAAVESCSVEAIDLILPFQPDMLYSSFDRDKETRVSVIRKLGGDHLYRQDCTAAAKRLIDLGADVNASNADGATLLHLVGSLKFTTFLLDQGANVNALRNDGLTPLAMAFDEDVALLLLGHGADPRLGDTGKNLRFNIKNNHWDRVKTWLAAHGYADVLVAQPDDDKPRKSS